MFCLAKCHENTIKQILKNQEINFSLIIMEEVKKLREKNNLSE